MPKLYNRINSVIHNNLFNKELEKILSLWPKHGTNKEIDSLAKEWESTGFKLDEYAKIQKSFLNTKLKKNLINWPENGDYLA